MLILSCVVFIQFCISYAIYWSNILENNNPCIMYYFQNSHPRVEVSTSNTDSIDGNYLGRMVSVTVDCQPGYRYTFSLDLYTTKFTMRINNNYYSVSNHNKWLRE